MAQYEYIVVPAPRKGVSGKGIKGVPGKFANALTLLMNEMALEGWDYQRTDTLPCEERQGLTGKAVKYHAMLVFRREIEADAPEENTPLLAAPAPEPEPEPSQSQSTKPAPKKQSLQKRSQKRSRNRLRSKPQQRRSNQPPTITPQRQPKGPRL